MTTGRCFDKSNCVRNSRSNKSRCCVFPL